MKTYCIFFIALLPVMLFAQKEGDCKEEKDSYATIQVYDNIVATLVRGEINELCVSAGANLEDLQITNSEGILRVRKIAGKKYENQPQVRIVYDSIRRIEGYGKADLDTKNLITTDSLDIILKSGSRFYASCDVKYLSVDVAEGALLKIDGYAINQKVESSGKATVSAFNLEGETAVVKAVRGGTAKLNIQKEIRGTVNTKGYIGYKNQPRIDVKKTTGGRLVAVD